MYNYYTITEILVHRDVLWDIKVIRVLLMTGKQENEHGLEVRLVKSNP